MPAAPRQVGALLVRDGRVLLCLRRANRVYYPGVWDVPGGHVDRGEAPGPALRRELHEELGIGIDAPAGPPLVRLTDAARGLDLAVWTIADWRGEPENCAPEEHAAIAWHEPERLESLPLADSRYVVLVRAAIALA